MFQNYFFFFLLSIASSCQFKSDNVDNKNNIIERKPIHDETGNNISNLYYFDKHNFFLYNLNYGTLKLYKLSNTVINKYDIQVINDTILVDWRDYIKTPIPKELRYFGKPGRGILSLDLKKRHKFLKNESEIKTYVNSEELIKTLGKDVNKIDSIEFYELFHNYISSQIFNFKDNIHTFDKLYKQDIGYDQKINFKLPKQVENNLILSQDHMGSKYMIFDIIIDEHGSVIDLSHKYTFPMELRTLIDNDVYDLIIDTVKTKTFNNYTILSIPIKVKLSILVDIT